MREMILKKVLPLVLSAVLLLGAFPLDVHVHAEDLSVEAQQAVLTRQMDQWFFPLPEECFDDIQDFAGCRGSNANALYGTTNEGCTQEGHANLVNGSPELVVSLSDTKPVYAPAAGTLYRSVQTDKWGDAVVIEAPVPDTGFSYYLILGSVSADAASGYVEAGTLLGYASGSLRFAALMDYTGRGETIAANISGELVSLDSLGWLTESTGVGFVCVNPSDATATQYPNDPVNSHSGPVSYRFVQASQPEPQPPAHSHVFDQAVASDAYLAVSANCVSGARYYYSCACGAVDRNNTFVFGDPSGEHSWNEGTVTANATHTTQGNIHSVCNICGAEKDDPIPVNADAHDFQPVVNEAYLAAPANCGSGARYYYSCACGAVDRNNTFVSGDPSGEHSWNEGTVTANATHTTQGNIHSVCNICGAEKDDPIPAITDHTFDQEVVEERYLASAATCSGPALYYKSCVCGEKGTETFSFGQPAPHTYSGDWSRDENNHWRAATCQHTGEVTDFGPHNWNDGQITKDAGHVTDGEKVYTCNICGVQKTEILLGQPHEYNQEIAEEKYLASAATCTSPALYYKSCVCGEKGTETFASGEAKGHTFSDSWSSDDLQHWRAATCEHTNERVEVAEHIWGPGEITTQPTATTKGVKTYTCTVCGKQKTEEVEPSEHQHTFAETWAGNSTYHWHPATCEHTNVVSGLGEHSWNEGVITIQPTHSTAGEKVFTCSVCNGQKKETISQTHTFDQMNTSGSFLASAATCTSPATYYYSCTCGAKDTTRTFTTGSALGHTASGVWGKDANYHWNVCSRCGAKGQLVAHTMDNTGKCTVCAYSKDEGHVHSSHLTRVSAKAPTCTADGSIAYYICDCGQWFTDVTCTTPITDPNSVVQPATGHVDQDNNGRCDVCKERLDDTMEYQITEGGESTWLNTSNQGMVFRSNAEYAKFDRVEVDGATVAVTNYSVSEGSTIVELNAGYLKRLSLGRHIISIVAKDGKATTGFTIKQGASATGQSGGSGIWGMILILAVIVAIAIPVTYGVYYYRRKTGNY